MAKRKGSLSLFEVIGRKPNSTGPAPAPLTGPGMIATPVQTSRAGQTPPPQARPMAAALSQNTAGSSAGQPAVRPPAMPGQAAPPVARPTKRVEPPFERCGDQYRVSLNFTSWAIVGGALLVLLVAVFMVGRASVARPVAFAGAPDGGSAPTGESGATDGNNTGTPTDKAAAAGKRQVGKYYLVIETMTLGDKQRQRADAEKIVDFLKAHDVPADLRSDRTQTHVVVWSLTPFDSDKSEVANDFAEKIKKLGSQYHPQDYHFRQTNGAMWLPYKEQ